MHHQLLAAIFLSRGRGKCQTAFWYIKKLFKLPNLAAIKANLH